jgi:hypothetical protein
MDKTEFLCWLIASPVIAGVAAWLGEWVMEYEPRRSRGPDTIRKWIAVRSSNSPRWPSLN